MNKTRPHFNINDVGMYEDTIDRIFCSPPHFFRSEKNQFADTRPEDTALALIISRRKRGREREQAPGKNGEFIRRRNHRLVRRSINTLLREGRSFSRLFYWWSRLDTTFRSAVVLFLLESSRRKEGGTETGVQMQHVDWSSHPQARSETSQDACCIPRFFFFRTLGI